MVVNFVIKDNDPTRYAVVKEEDILIPFERNISSCSLKVKSLRTTATHLGLDGQYFPVELDADVSVGDMFQDRIGTPLQVQEILDEDYGLNYFERKRKYA